jgi:hypothetical protein
MENLKIYNSVADVPQEAQKTITAGRIKGMTDINPMWRIQKLTETFGVAGFGWKYVITDKRITEGADGTVCAFVDIDLFVKLDGEWSEAIQGTGGSQFVSVEKNGKYTNDECFKMALTDALSVACKALGIGANVYWSAGSSKYGKKPKTTPPKQDTSPTPKKQKTPRELLIAKLHEKGIDINTYAVEKGLNKDTTAETYTKLLAELEG